LALKYPNKSKHVGYWQRYEHADIKNHRKVWDFLDAIIEQIGLPFGQSPHGLRPKLSVHTYAKIIVYLVYFDLDLRAAEEELGHLEGKTIDHTNIDRWFWRVDDEWIRRAIQLLH
jgi:hypothetical protein